MSEKILFVCAHGGAKSVIAAEFFNRQASAAGLPHRAEAAAAEDPYESVPAPVAQLLQSDGIDVGAFTPRRIEPGELRNGARVITMSCAPEIVPPSGVSIESWDDVPAPSQDLAGSVAAIRRHVDALARELAAVPRPSLWQFTAYFLRLGALGFGGPIALAGSMQRDLVEERRWVTAEEYTHGLALAQLAPGPLAAQLAIYLGWVRAGISGATLVALAFVLPSFLMVLAISAAYVRYDGMPWIGAAFYGIGAAVIAIIVRSAFKLARIGLRRDILLWLIFIANAVATAVMEAEIISLVIASGLVAWAASVRAGQVSASSVTEPETRNPEPGTRNLTLPLALTVAASNAGASMNLFWFFVKAGAFVFGSGLAIVPFLYSGVVRQQQWLSEQQFLDAVAIAMITPGPVVITVAFIGYLVDGVPGAALAAAGVFLPCYLLVILPAPYFARFAGKPQLKAFIAGVTAAATGAIAGAAFVLARRAIFDLTTLLIFAVSLALVVWVKRISEPLLIVAVGVLSVALHLAR